MYENSALVIIDMQTEFHASNPYWLIKNICEKIKLFKRDQRPIYVLEYSGDGPTQQPIMDLLCDYPKCYILEKSQDDGSKVITRHFMRHGISRHVYLTGVNADACVLQTAKGLKSRIRLKLFGGIKVSIFKNCVNWESGTNKAHLLGFLEKAYPRNIKIAA